MIGKGVLRGALWFGGNMVAGPDYMRAMRLSEADQVDALLRAAFPGPDEANLVRHLRAAGQIETEVVLPWEDGIVGYLALSRLQAPAGWLVLAPVAVAPVWQGRRLGSRLVAMTMRLAAIKGQSVVVVGKPSFYARAGFSVQRAAGLKTPYPAEFTAYFDPGSDAPEAEVIYPPAFALLRT